jgi:hypothetical protein
MSEELNVEQEIGRLAAKVMDDIASNLEKNFFSVPEVSNVRLGPMAITVSLIGDYEDAEGGVSYLRTVFDDKTTSLPERIGLMIMAADAQRDTLQGEN